MMTPSRTITAPTIGVRAGQSPAHARQPPALRAYTNGLCSLRPSNQSCSSSSFPDSSPNSASALKFRTERLQILRLLPEPDEKRRQLEFLVQRNDHGRPFPVPSSLVSTSPVTFRSLWKTPAPDSAHCRETRIDREPHLMRRTGIDFLNRAADLRKFVHQPFLVVLAAPPCRSADSPRCARARPAWRRRRRSRGSAPCFAETTCESVRSPQSCSCSTAARPERVARGEHHPRLPSARKRAASFPMVVVFFFRCRLPPTIRITVGLPASRVMNRTRALTTQNLLQPSPKATLTRSAFVAIAPRSYRSRISLDDCGGEADTPKSAEISSSSSSSNVAALCALTPGEDRTDRPGNPGRGLFQPPA